ncbi:NAD(P)/FAD-dependent oxidoreductase [Parasphingopyxis lamellibrachiae]|uniref:D-arginine dehydrogenase n=1 Tax=Parasphingopyxis lamellibrachiae TaxID=680125 RepID=A0A3D9FJB7_9SPHN|nr:FAD-dependent oxidoreductase [Parasphingopyxis lamellibrachiae]RED17748.1 D-arginine dehydrogenase [Parasphingopyxis lamellibrachiae]
MRSIDTVLIGGGIAGLSAAARIARHGETVVLERESAAGYHSSGRSATFCHFGIGDGLVHKLTAISKTLFAAPPEGDHPALARRMAAFFIARADEEEQLDRLTETTLAHSPQARRIPGAELRDIVPVLNIGDGGFAAGLFDPDAYKLDSDAMLQANIRALRAAGGVLVTDAPVGAIRREGARWIVDTPGESYAAKRIVNAAGAWADTIAEMASVGTLGLMPLRRTIIAFRPPEGVDVSGWPFTKTVGEGFYMLPEGSGQLLASPMDESASPPCDAQPDEETVALAAWRVEQGTTMPIRRIDHKWSGLRTFAPDHSPVAGYAPDAPGFFWLAGQGGFGLQTSPGMAMAAEALLLELEWPEALVENDVRPEMLRPDRLRITR